MTEQELLKQLEQKITKEYKDTEAVIRQKIAYFTKDFDKDNKLYQQQVKDGKITKNEYKNWYKNQIATKKWSQKMSKEIASDITNASVTASKYINNDSSEVFMYGCLEASKELKDYANFEVFDKKQINQLMNHNKEYLPKSKVDIPKDQKWNERRIQSSLMQSALKGESIPKLANRLSTVVGMSRSSAVRNARTMMTASHNMGKLETGYEAIDMGIDVKKKWIATFDNRTRNSHALLHGEVVDMDEEFSNGLMFPADPDGDPSEVYNCRCTMALVDEEKTKGMSKEEFEENVEQNMEAKEEFYEANKMLKNSSTDEDIFSVGWEATNFDLEQESTSVDNRKTFQDVDEAEEWIYNPENSNAGIWEDELDSIEEGIAYEYTDTAYRSINNYLRGIWDEEYAEGELDGFTEGLSMDYVTEKLDSAINKSVIHEPFTAKRCMGIEMLDRFEVGESFIDLGYGSSTIDPDLNFMGNPVRMDIAIPSGKGIGAYVNGLSYYEDIEYEFLIGRGAEYITLEKEKRTDAYGDSYWYVLAELVGVGRSG